MAIGLSWSWFRRLLAHLTTPIVVGLLWALLLANGGEGFLSDIGPAIGLCYFAWLFLGFPGLLFRRRERSPSAWRYVAWGLFLAAVPFLLFPSNLVRSVDWWMLAMQVVPIGAVAGLWYWFCAYWPRGGPTGASEAGPAASEAG